MEHFPHNVLKDIILTTAVKNQNKIKYITSLNELI